jgi:hypothetical protein
MKEAQKWIKDKFKKLTATKKATFAIGVLVGMAIMAIIVLL